VFGFSCDNWLCMRIGYFVCLCLCACIKCVVCVCVCMVCEVCLFEWVCLCVYGV